jgi:hypothetical protein
MEALMREYGINPTELIDIQGQWDNYQFVRVLLPNNSQIEQQDGMVIRNYGSRKWVEFFLRTRPTETTTYRIDYSLPNPDCQQYSYKHLKQPGIREYDIEVVSENKQDSFTWLREDFFYADWEDSSL